MSAPNPLPEAIIRAAQELCGDLDRIHVMHECDDDCPDRDGDCPNDDGWDYSQHDEYNADVREQIEESASGLLAAIEAHFGAIPTERENR